MEKNKIEVGIYYYIDENGKKVYDFEEMANEFEQKLSELDDSVVVMVSVE
jgi:6-pyruvoyl-tetrahydropterin synthase